MCQMTLFQLFWFFHVHLAFVAYGAPSFWGFSLRDVTSQPTTSNNTASPPTFIPLISNASDTPLMNASALIRDSRGADITSSFQVKVYRQAPRTTISNITEENNLSNRQTMQVLRLIDSCYGNETFIESHCTPNNDDEATMQAYVYTCRKTVDHWSAGTGQYLGRLPAYRTRQGSCEPMELCMDGFGDKQMASCVHTSIFDDYMMDKDGMVKGMLNGEIFDVAKAWAAMSKSDKKTPLKSKTLGIGAWNSASRGGKGNVQSKKCRNCADLETDVLRPDTDSLRLEATLMSTSAIGGILWLALGAG